MTQGTFVEFTCAHCGKVGKKRSGDVNRARSQGRRLFCNRECASKGHRSDFRTPEQKIAEKAEYDRLYRVKEANRVRKKAYGSAWYQANRDREKEREVRIANMPRHVEYCRQPEYRAKKHQYDVRRQSQMYGEFAEAHRLLVELEREIIKLTPDKYERLKARGYFEQQNIRRREKRQQQRDARNTYSDQP